MVEYLQPILHRGRCGASPRRRSRGGLRRVTKQINKAHINTTNQQIEEAQQNNKTTSIKHNEQKAYDAWLQFVWRQGGGLGALCLADGAAKGEAVRLNCCFFIFIIYIYIIIILTVSLLSLLLSSLFLIINYFDDLFWHYFYTEARTMYPVGMREELTQLQRGRRVEYRVTDFGLFFGLGDHSGVQGEPLV